MEWQERGEAYKGAAERFRRRCLAAVPLEGLFDHGRPLRRDHAAASVAFGVEEIREAILDGIEAQLSQEEVEHLRKQRGEGGDAWAVEFGSCEMLQETCGQHMRLMRQSRVVRAVTHSCATASQFGCAEGQRRGVERQLTRLTEGVQSGGAFTRAQIHRRHV